MRGCRLELVPRLASELRDGGGHVTINELLEAAVKAGASDLHLTTGVPPMLRIAGLLQPVKGYPKLTPQDCEALILEMMNDNLKARYAENGEVDFSYGISGVARFRVNAYTQRGSKAAAIRVIPSEIRRIEELGIPEVVKTFAQKTRGLVLVTGPTGSGKSTTLAALIDLINNERPGHIITLEDPIEYLHRHNKAIINQREIGTDSKSFASALRAALREDPDVILIGEMRDLETTSIALTAAETGHLVFATLHTNDSVQTVDRIIDQFPPHQQQQVRVQLSTTLIGVVSQQLIPRADGLGRVVAVEVMVATPAVRNLIREGKTHQLYTVIQTGGKYGMQTMNASLKALYQRGLISREEALMRATDPDEFRRLVDGYAI